MEVSEDSCLVKKKNPEIPTLDSYSNPPPEEFWKNFPSMSLPTTAETNVIGENLMNKILESSSELTYAQLQRGLGAVNLVTNGADCKQKHDLPACMQNNANSAIKYGEAVTDTVASWIKDGFVAGPFDSPPLDRFRVNCLMAIPQPGKIRPVLNGSLPKNESLNSNVDPLLVERVKMCSARCFSYSVVEAGDSCHMAKMDMVNAYKNVPCTPEEYRLQGFHWLGKFFVETRQIFGAKTAVCNYDVLANTVLSLSLTKCKIDRSFVHRQLDDVPVVAPADKIEWCKEFTDNYKECCENVGIALAPDDPNKEKAFYCSKEGKVLGIDFRTDGLKWAYPEEKKTKLLIAIEEFLTKDSVNLLQMQKLMGRINDVGLMTPFMKMFKGPLNEILGWLQKNPDSECMPKEQAKADILVWVGFICDKEKWHPIAHRPISPPLSRFEFTSDAAGMPENSEIVGQVGFGTIGFNPNDEIILVHQTFWPDSLSNKKDSKGSNFGSKTVFLEAIGMIAPLLLIPDSVKESHVILGVDNIACYYGWVNKSVSGDTCASIVFRALGLISAYLSVYVHVVHVPRMSTWEARICDRLSTTKDF